MEPSVQKMIMDVIGLLPDHKLEALDEVFTKYGVENDGDVKYVSLDDLLPILTPVQAMRLVEEATDMYEMKKQERRALSNPEQSNRPCACKFSPNQSLIRRAVEDSLPSSSSNLGLHVKMEWYEGWEPEIPTHLIEDMINFTLTDEKRRDIVRAVTDQVHKRVDQSRRAEGMQYIARNLCSRYPVLLDQMTGERVGTGELGFLKQLTNRLDNLRRKRVGPGRAIKLNKSHSSSSPVSSTGSEGGAIKRTNDQYGCVNWQPENPPEGEDSHTQDIKRRKLSEIDCGGPASCEMLDLQCMTYYSQRKDINNCMPTGELRERWPTIFSFEGCIAHAETLTGKNFMRNVFDNYEEKGGTLFQFYQQNLTSRLKPTWDEIEETIENTGSNDCIYPGLFMLTTTFMAETSADILVQGIPTESTEVWPHLPKTPCIIYCGESPLNCGRFMLAVDQVIVNTGVDTFLSALAMVFALYFNLNMKYGDGCQATMDLFQRLIIGINPEKGSKVTCKNAKGYAHPRVTTFLTKYSSFINTAGDSERQ